jgi:EAL domain-containing protein (putative c-di-GMP-specific phosphodiesterase class I)
VKTQSDFLAVRELGFDLLQGEMFAKPMTPRNSSGRCSSGITRLSA